MLDSGNTARKLLPLDKAAEATRQARAAGKRVVLAHGVFDVLHIGHLRHLGLARREGDLLVVSVTADAFVNKGPGRPVFPDSIRAEMLAALDLVDLVVINPAATAVPVIDALRPAVYVKGAEYRDSDRDVTGKIVDERDAVEAVGGRVVFTDDVVFSSSSLINRFLEVYEPQLREYLDSVREKHLLENVIAAVDRVAALRVLLVGDAILDDYQYVTPMGKSPKENIIASRFQDREIFAGGVLAAANHVAGICREVEVITCLGRQDDHEDLIRASLKPNVRLRVIYRSDAPTTRKTRFVDSSYVRKLFEVYYFNDLPLAPDLQAEIDDQIREIAPGFDAVIVTDFGHGMIADSTIDALRRSARFLAVNAQSNSANFGFNLVTRYPRADFICLDDPEARLAAADKHGDIETIVRDRLATRIDCPRIIVTRGKVGCITYDATQGFHHIPAFTKTVVDTVGAGDAFLAIASPLVAAGVPLDLVGLVGNAAGALKVGVVGHRQSVDKVSLLKYLTALLK